MRADTRTVTIDAPQHKVVQFLSNPENLPRWAVGFAKSVRRDGERWIVTAQSGAEIGVRIVADPASGVIDFHMSPAPGVEGLAASRAVPCGDGVAYVFTQFQAPGMTDEMFARSVQAVMHELTMLKALLEVACPL